MKLFNFIITSFLIFLFFSSQAFSGEKDLVCLSKLMDIDDENLYKYNQGLKTTVKINENKVTKLFRDFVYQKFNGGETGIRTQERVAPLPVFKTGAFNRSAISPLVSVYFTN